MRSLICRLSPCRVSRSFIDFSFPFACSGTMKRRCELMLPWLVFHSIVCILSGMGLLVTYLHRNQYLDNVIGDAYSVCKCQMPKGWCIATEERIKFYRIFSCFRVYRDSGIFHKHFLVVCGSCILRKSQNDETSDRGSCCADSMSSGECSSLHPVLEVQF